MKIFWVKFIKNIFRYLLLLFILSTLAMYVRLVNIRARKARNVEELWKEAEEIRANHILLWSKKTGPEWKTFKAGDVSFRDHRCKFDNCFVTDNDQLLPSVAMFDAILFDGVDISKSENYELPKERDAKQLYIFSMKQSASNYPVCDPKYDNFFNLTWTYRLDSDIHWPYFYVYNHRDEVVGPRANITWASTYLPVPEEYHLLVDEKEFTAIWIASNCVTNSGREMLVNKLKHHLKLKKLYVETVGACGLKQCPEKMEHACLKMMYKYYFYFAFEKSLDEDYITENVLKAFKNYMVPVVFGGANYSRFLPPHSYIDVAEFGLNGTLVLMERLMEDKSAYLDYFRWRNHYILRSTQQYVCKLCEILNSGVENVYTDFRHWWNPKTTKGYGRSEDPKVCKNKM